MAVSTTQQVKILLQMYWAMVKNKILMMGLFFAIPIVAAFFILLAMAVTYTVDTDSFVSSQTIFHDYPGCGSGLIGIYPPNHPITDYLLQHYSNEDPSPLDITPNVILIENDFQKNCVDILYDKSNTSQHLSLIGCINFEKVIPQKVPFPTAAPKTTTLIQYDVFALSYDPLLEPMNAGEYYRFEENPNVNDAMCSIEFLNRANNLASVAILHHYGLYDNIIKQQSIENNEEIFNTQRIQHIHDESQLNNNNNQQNDTIFTTTVTNNEIITPEQLGIELSPTTTTIGTLMTHIQSLVDDTLQSKSSQRQSKLQHIQQQSSPTQQQSSPTQQISSTTPFLTQQLPTHDKMGPMHINTRLMASRDPFRTNGGVYTTFLAQQSLTIILFMPILLLTLIPYTKFKQDGQISLLLINGINHFSILLAMFLFAMANGLFPMFVYSYVLFIWWDFLPTLAMVIFYLLYFTAAVTFVLLIGSIFTRVRPATQVLIGIFSIFAFVGFFIDTLPIWITFIFAPFIFQFTYSLAWKTFLVYLTHSESLQFSMTYAANGGCSYLTAIILFICNICITFGLTLYFQQIIPTPGVITKPWYFIFDLSLWHIHSPTAADAPQLYVDGHQYLEFTPPRALRLTNHLTPHKNTHSTQTHKLDDFDSAGNYAQFDDEERHDDMIDDLNRRKMDDIDTTTNKNNYYNEDDYDSDDEEYCPETDIGYLPPLHPYQPLNDYESDNIILSFQNVRKTYGTIHKHRTHALKHVNLQISRQLVVLLGKNGSGKSTLLQLMTGLALPSAGSIKITLPQQSQRSQHSDSLAMYNMNNNNVTQQLGVNNGTNNNAITARLDPFATHHTSNDPFAMDATNNNINDGTNNNTNMNQHSENVEMSTFMDGVISTTHENHSNYIYNGPRPLFGYCPQDNTLFPYLTVREHLRHMSKLIQLSYLTDSDELLNITQIDQIITDVTSRLGLNSDSILDAKVNTLPHGIQRRLCVAISSLHHPTILLLDDPLTSLDLHSQRLLLDYLQYLKTLGTTIIMTSNNISEVEFADKIGIISHGNVLLYGSPNYIKNLYHAGYCLSIEKIENEDIFGDCLQLSSTPVTSTQMDDDNNNDTNNNNDGVDIPIGFNDDETITTKSGQAIYNAIQQNHKFATLCNVIYDSQTEINFILDNGFTSFGSTNSFNNISSSSSTSNFQQSTTIPQLLSFLDGQKSTLGIRNLKLTMKTLEDVFIAVNQGKTTLRNPKLKLTTQIMEGTLPELAFNIEKKQYDEEKQREMRRKTAAKFNTDLDDSNDPYLQLNNDTNGQSDDIFDSEHTTTTSSTTNNEINNIGSDTIDTNQIDEITHGQLDSVINDHTQYHNLSTKFSQLWQYPFSYQPLESILLTQISGHLRKDYQILWNTPTKFTYLIFVPIFICIAIFFTSPHNIVLSTSSQPLPLSLQALPSQSPIEWGISNANPIEPTFTTTSEIDYNDHKQSIQNINDDMNAFTALQHTITNLIQQFQFKPMKNEQLSTNEYTTLSSTTNSIQFNPQQSYERSPRIQIEEFIKKIFATNYKLDDTTMDKLDDIDMLEYFTDKKHKEPLLLPVLQQFYDQQMNYYPGLRSPSRFKYNNPRLLTLLASYNSTIDEDSFTFTDFKGTIYVNHTALPMGFSLATRMYETIYNYAVQQQYPQSPVQSYNNPFEEDIIMNTQQLQQSPAAIMLLPTLTQIYNQADIGIHSGHALVLGLLMTIGLSCYPIIQSYYYTREKVTGWDDIQKIHGLYIIAKWFSRAVYDLSIYLLHVIVIAISVAISGYGRNARETFVEFDYDFSVIGHFVTICAVIGIQLLLFMHCFIYFFHKDPIKSQTYLMITLFFGPVFVFIGVLITSVIGPLMIVVLLIGAICPTTILLIAVVLTFYAPQSIWIVLTISILESILLIFFAVISATVKPLACTAENLLYKNRHEPTTVSQNPNDHTPYRHVYVSELASREMYNVVHDYNNDTHPILSYGLLKKYGIISAVNNVYFGVADNTTMALIGPNQAGKTTLLKLLLNLESTSLHSRTTNYPTNKPFNTATICKCDTQSKHIEKVTHHEGIGYCPQDLSFLNQHLTARQHLEWMGCIRGLSESLIDDYTSHLLTTTGLLKVADKRVQSYTPGMKQRLAVALALIGNPKILIMDEMTEKCDPLSSIQIRDLIKKTSLTRTTLFTSHNIDDVEALGDKICILSHGVITAIGTKEELITTLGQYYSLHITTLPSQEDIAINLLLTTFSNHPNVIEFDTQQSILMNPAPSNLEEFTTNDTIHVNQINQPIPQQPPIKLIESRQQRIICHINSNYFSLSSIFDILYALQTQHETIIQSYTISHLGLEDCLLTSVQSTSLTEQRAALPANIHINDDSDNDDNDNSSSSTRQHPIEEVVLDTTITTSAAQAIAHSSNSKLYPMPQDLYNN